MLLERIGFETKAVATATIPPRRLSATDRLMRAVREIAGSLARIVEHRETPWASITFTGTRHCLVLRFEGGDAVSDGEAFVTALPEHEFRIHGQLVADAAITRVDHALLPAPLLEVECEILLLDED